MDIDFPIFDPKSRGMGKETVLGLQAARTCASVGAAAQPASRGVAGCRDMEFHSRHFLTVGGRIIIIFF